MISFYAESCLQIEHKHRIFHMEQFYASNFFELSIWLLRDRGSNTRFIITTDVECFYLNFNRYFEITSILRLNSASILDRLAPGLNMAGKDCSRIPKDYQGLDQSLAIRGSRQGQIFVSMGSLIDPKKPINFESSNNVHLYYFGSHVSRTNLKRDIKITVPLRAPPLLFKDLSLLFLT